MTSDDLINILYESGREIVYKRVAPFNDEIYKSVDVWKVSQYADERFQSKLVLCGRAYPGISEGPISETAPAAQSSLPAKLMSKTSYARI